MKLPRIGTDATRPALRAASLLACLFACLWVAVISAQAAPQIAGVAQVGNPATPGTRYVFVYLQFYDDAKPHPAYAVYHKPGLEDAPVPYQRLAIIRATTHIPTVTAFMQRAADAGFDNLALESDLDNSLPPGPYGSLAAKVAAFFEADLPGSYDAQQRQAMLRVHPQTALTRGQAYIARVPDSGPNTFEVRVVNPLTQEEGPVVARVTSPALPATLPPPDGLSERRESRPRGDLRVYLRWCVPPTLAEMTFHWSGFKVFRVPRQTWRDAFGMDPPLNMTRQMLLNALSQNPALAVQVNRLPVLPNEDLPCPPPPNSAAFFLTDDNDSPQQAAFAPGGTSFLDGFQATYFLAVCDHFGRIGELSPGLEVQICDRLPPASPSQVRVDNIYKQEGATDHTLRISWQREAVEEVRRYHLFRYLKPDDALLDRQNPLWPATPNRIAIIPNPAAGERVAFTDLTPGALALPANDGETRWFSLVAEDATSCPSLTGLGNLSGPSGAVPGSLYDLANEAMPQGRLLIPCCRVVVTMANPGTIVPLPLVGIRAHPHITHVEFRERLSNTHLGSFAFGANNQVAFNPSFQGPANFQARFITASGLASDWTGNFTQNLVPPIFEQRWTGDYACSRVPEFCFGGVIDTKDPITGELINVCVQIINPPVDAVEAAFYRRLGDTGPLVMMQRAKLDTNGDGVNDLAEMCELAPPANPGRACFFLQYFDRNGNPSVVALMGCINTLGTEGFPTPRITHFVPDNLEPPLNTEEPATLAWFGPRPGVDRFDIAISPPPPGVTTTFQEGNEAGVGKIWGVLESDRLANGFLDGSPNFAVGMNLERGKDYQAKVRSTGEGLYGERNTGVWSDVATITWLLEPPDGGGLPADCPVPWPARDIAPLITDPARELDAIVINWEDFIPNVGPRPTTEIWIKVGCFNFGQLLTPSMPSMGTVQPPDPRVAVDDLTPHLLVPLPFTVYLHQTSSGSRGTMLQVSHYVDEILTTQPAPGELVIIDRAFAAQTLLSPRQLPCLWFRVRQPLVAGRTYRCAVVRHGPDREPIETLRTVEVTVPALP